MNRAGVAGIAAGRMAVGAAVWLSPRQALRALGFDSDGVELRTLARIAGTRDLALGGLQLAALRSSGQSRVIARTAAAVDAGDAAAFGLLLLRRQATDRAALIGLGSAAGAAAAGGWLAKRLG